MPSTFLGFDHADFRVVCLGVVELFYDALMPELGLPVKTYAFVDVALRATLAGNIIGSIGDRSEAER